MNVRTGMTPPVRLLLQCAAWGGATGAGPAGGPLGAVVTGAGTAGAAVGEEGPAVVTGVTMTPVTSPLMASFCFLLVVPRAMRVALIFAVAAARFSLSSGLRALGGARPKSASDAAVVLNVARTKPR